MSIRFTYIYSACYIIETPDVRILCDPWFTEGAFEGSWYHYPVIDLPEDMYGSCELVYISHIHPDHYDKTFLRKYCLRYPNARIVIAPFARNYLGQRMAADNIPHEIVAHERIGDTHINLLPNESDPFDIDSALVVRRGENAVVNLNDNAFNAVLIKQIRDIAPSIDIAAMGYTGAHPYPHTYFDIGDELVTKAAEKRRLGLDRYRRLRSALGATITIPSAGQYLLGGRLHYLNPYRGVADAVDVLEIDDHAIVLADNGGWIDTATMVPSAVRRERYDPNQISRRCLEISSNPLRYETMFADLDIGEIPFTRLIETAYKRASSRSVVESTYWFCILIGSTWAVFNADRRSPQLTFEKRVNSLVPRSEVYIDPRCLFGALTGVFHWNNLTIGAQYYSRRYPDIWNREAEQLLNYFHV